MKIFFHHNKFLRKSYSENAANLATTMATLLVAFVVGSSYLFGVFALPSQALATDSQIAAVGFGLEKAADQANLTTSESLGSRVGSILKVVFNILGIVFLLVVVVAGLMWMTAAGNEDIIRKSKQAIVAASIGFIIVALSGTLVEYFTTKARIAPTPPPSSPSDGEIRDIDTGECQKDEDCGEGMVCTKTINDTGRCLDLNTFGACITDRCPRYFSCTNNVKANECSGYFVEGERCNQEEMGLECCNNTDCEILYECVNYNCQPMGY